MLWWVRMTIREQYEAVENLILADIDKRLAIMRVVAKASKGLNYIQYFDLQIAEVKT